MRFYTASHISWIVAIAAASILLSVLARRDRISKPWLRAALALFMVGGELQRYFKDGMHFPDSIPLHLCNIATWCAVVACIWLSPLAGEFAYFAGLAGAGMAILTPDMGSEWNTRFFVNHGGLIVTVVVLIAGRLLPIRPRAMWRAYALVLTYAALLGVFNWKFGTNYGYLAHKPGQKTVFDLLGPWPYYIVGLALLGLAIFALLALPLRSRRAIVPSSPRAESRVASAAGAGRGAAIQPQS